MEAPGLELLQENRALEVLIQLSETPGILRTTLYDKIIKNGAGKQTVIKRVDELIFAGLIRIEPSPTHKKGQLLYLTDQGKQIADLAMKMKNVLDNDLLEDDRINHGTSAATLGSVTAKDIKESRRT